MDQMACSVGRPDEALFLDTRSLHTIRAHPLAVATLAFVVINSGCLRCGTPAVNTPRGAASRSPLRHC